MATPPAILRPHQVDAWRRATAALEGWSGAIVAEPVGTGKTWIALAVARHLRTAVTVIGPAALANQWREAAARAGVRLRWHSLERLSRGHPPAPARFVVVDEAHRLRHRDTRRVATLAPWLLGRRTLFLTATPIVNRRDDLLSLLALLVPDDALSLDGVPSLRELTGMATPPGALRRLVIRSSDSAATVPIRERRLRIAARERRRGDRVVAALATLRLGDDPGVRQLLTTVLLDAGASSDAAWHAALHRYRLLLHHARDAGGASRDALRRLAGPSLDQVVLWPLMGDLPEGTQLPLEDLPAVEAILDATADDVGWIEPLRRMLGDGQVSVCFCRHRATARALAMALGDGTAWVTGEQAGIGPHRIARSALLGAFGPDRDRWRQRRTAPAILVATEVLAEGLDLQAASRVVHVDLPWHATRIEQRTGRVRRVGQSASVVEVVTRPVPRAIERALGMRHRIRRKGRLAARWLAALAEGSVAPRSRNGTAVVASARLDGPRAIIWIELAAGSRVGCVAIAIVDHHAPQATDPAIPVGGITGGTSSDPGRAVPLAARAVRHALAASMPPYVGRPALVARILSLARCCAADRRREDLTRLDRLLTLATRPGPHGLDLILDRLRHADDATLLRTSLPASPDRTAPEPRRLAVLLDRRPRPRLPCPMAHPTTVLFDLDGTIIDSIDLIVESYLHTFRTHGLSGFTRDEIIEGIGTPLVAVFSRLTADPRVIDEWIATYRSFNLAHHDTMVRPFPGAVEMVRRVHSAGRRLGLVTSKNNSGARRGLALAGLDGVMEVIVGADDVTRHKPDPEPVLQALRLLGVAAQEAIYIGDSHHDVASGRAAGVRTLAVCWGPMDRQRLTAAGADLVCDTPEEVLAGLGL